MKEVTYDAKKILVKQEDTMDENKKKSNKRKKLRMKARGTNLKTDRPMASTRKLHGTMCPV